ncbi:MAG: TonB-dependent receptor [Alphaproteobacteria bacterium]|nr:TonB-dependent receptor [Alphaproteobacteria bacterium]
MKHAFVLALLASAAPILCPETNAQDRVPVPADAAIDTVIVTARLDPEDPPLLADVRARLSRTPGAVSAVSNEAFEARAAQGLSDMLRDVPGLVVQKRYGEESRFSIRGSGLGQSFHQRGVLFAQDGVPFADADGFSDFQKIDPLTARYVEVYRGGNALRFGGAQLGGAVNLVTPTGRTAQSANLVRLEGGSFDFWRGGGQLARVAGKADLFAAVTGMSAEGFREQSAQDQLRGTVNLGYRLGEDREIRLIAYAADIAQEVPGTLTLSRALSRPQAAGANVIATDWARDQTVWRTSLQGRWRFTEGALFEGGLYATGTDLHHPISLLIEQDISTQGAFGRLDLAGTAFGHRADLYLGASYRQGTVDQILGPVLFPVAGDSRRKARGLDLFGEGRWFATGRLAIVAGGSFGWADRDYTDNLNAANDDSADYAWFAPRIGLLVEHASGAQTYANLTRSVEPPHHGALVQAPFPGFLPIRPQDAWTAEIGTRGRTARLVWDLTAYRSQIEDELLAFNAVYGLPSATANADRTVHQGIEAALDWTVLPQIAGGSLLLRSSYAWSDFRFEGDTTFGDNRLPVIPQHQLRAMVRFRHAAGWFLAPAVEWRIGDTFVDYANTLEAPGYAVVSLNAGWDIGAHVSVFLDARNLTGKAHVPEFGAITDASAPGANRAVFYPGEGRAIYAGLLVRF